MSETSTKNSLVLLITNNGVGKGDIELQHKLMKAYLKLLIEHDLLPGAICFYTDGVKLAVEGSPVIDELKSLEEKGARLMLCGTCLNHYGLVDKVQVGIVGGMTDIIEAQWRAEKVITP
jgi:selenium metabolism protein YedF